MRVKYSLKEHTVAVVQLVDRKKGIKTIHIYQSIFISRFIEVMDFFRSIFFFPIYPIFNLINLLLRIAFNWYNVQCITLDNLGKCKVHH